MADLVTTADLRTVRDQMGGHCIGGTHAWFKHHGLDWRRFVQEGLPEADLLATGDTLCQHLVDAARRRREGA